MDLELQKLHTKLQKIENELKTVRGCSPLTHGWQTQKLAKSQRKWDELSKEKFIILQKIEDYELN